MAMAMRSHFSERHLRSLPAKCVFVALAATLVLIFAQASPSQTAQANQSAAQSPDQSQDRAKSAPAQIAVPLPKGKKLILKDGTFQIVREYHREGDSVRYYSAERAAWEEIPAELVDFPATQKAEAEQDAKDQKLVAKLKAADLAARTANIEADSSFEVRPGVLLPDGVGLYALSGGEIFTLAQSLAVSHVNKGRMVEILATGVPIIPEKHNIEIPGKHAKLRISSKDLEFYFRTADGRVPDMNLLRTDIQGDKRKLEDMSTNIVGINDYKGHEIRIQVWDAAHGLYRFTVEQALAPGEYALVESSPEGDVSLYVWDFGVDPTPGEASAAVDHKQGTKP
jgi:hypothetical protein